MRWRIISLWIMASVQVFSSTSVIIGKDASASGAVLMGHNQDDEGQRIVNVWHVGRSAMNQDDPAQPVSGINLPPVKETWAYLWFQMNGLAGSDLYMNEWSVTVTGNACPSRLDSTQAPGKIGYWLRKCIAERAQSAKEGIKIAGELLDLYGFDGYGSTLIICDPNEAWLLFMPGGLYWMAQRIPDNAAVVVSDRFMAVEAHFQGDKDQLFSKADIRQTAIDLSLYNPGRDTGFLFGSVFDRNDSDDLRQQRGQQLISGNPEDKMTTTGDQIPWMISPRRKIKLTDMMMLLRDHLEGTSYEMPQTGTETGIVKQMDSAVCKFNPNYTKLRSICTGCTQYAAVAELRNWLPWPAGGVLWISFGRPDCHPFLPWYAAVDSIPDVYLSTPDLTDWKDALDHHFNPVPGTFDYDPRSAYWIQNELENIADLDYSSSMSIVLPVRDAIEKRLIEFQPVFESSMLRLWKKNSEEAPPYCNQLLRSATDETLQKSMQLIRKLKGMNFK